MDKYLTFVKLPERIRKLREEHGFKTQQAFADALRVDRSVVKSWERFKKPVLPRLENLLSMCQLFECDLDYLIGSIEERTHDIQTACQLTGLSAKAIEKITSKDIGCLAGRLLSHIIESDNFEDLLKSYGTFLETVVNLQHYDRDEPAYELLEGNKVILNTNEASKHFMRNVALKMMYICEEEYLMQSEIRSKNITKKRMDDYQRRIEDLQSIFNDLFSSLSENEKDEYRKQQK